jgi:hypothetical protein
MTKIKLDFFNLYQYKLILYSKILNLFIYIEFMHKLKY